MSTHRTAEVAVVGGGPAGAAIAIRLASAAVDVVLFERLPAPRWRASGVYSSPATREQLAALGLSEAQSAALVRPIEAMEVVGPGGSACRLDYPGPRHACGVDRVRLERALLDRAVAAGARVLEGAVVRGIGRTAAGGSALEVSTADGVEHWDVRLLVGADGPGSFVARTFGVARPVRRLRQAGLTMHRVDPDAAPDGRAMTARMTIGHGWYCGVAPVPGGRVNIGIVMSGARLRDRLRACASPAAVAREVLDALPEPRARWQDRPDADIVCAALPLAHRVSRRSGPGWLLVGDAAGFIDPLSGDGLHRAFVSSELAADAVVAALHRGGSGALERYDRRMRARFAPKDVVSWVLQVLLTRPATLDYALRRLARRDGLRQTFARALADLEPAGRLLEPRFLAGLLRP